LANELYTWKLRFLKAMYNGPYLALGKVSADFINDHRANKLCSPIVSLATTPLKCYDMKTSIDTRSIPIKLIYKIENFVIF
jgi:hypothetical protein